jgi:thioester reductase-like protein
LFVSQLFANTQRGLMSTEQEIQRAMEALRRAKEKILSLERAQNEPIAIIGYACRFPGASSPEALWELLQKNQDASTDIPSERFEIDKFYDPTPLSIGKTYCRRAGVVPFIERFDAEFFGFSKSEAETTDPQQRMLLEVSWEAFERAGLTREQLRGSKTGVYVGLCKNDYAERFLQTAHPERVNAYVGVGNTASTTSGRVAYSFGLRGPALTLDTACSSSLVAAHLACQALRQGECERALVAGVNALLSPIAQIYFSQLGVLSRSGKTRPFSQDADGYLRSDGCGVLLLQRLSEAQREGAPILAVIRGTAVNQNGQGNGLVAPNRAAQEEVIRAALRSAQLSAEEIGMIEASGTATPMGDAIELSALRSIFGANKNPLYLSAIKANIGHTEGAAGVAGLLKAALSLQKKSIPPFLLSTTPHSELPWGAPFVLPKEGELHPAAKHIGVSAFGFSGTNAHMILSAPPEASHEEYTGPLYFPLSAQDPEALQQWARALASFVQERQPSLTSIAFTLQQGRETFASRACISANSIQDLCARLLELKPGATSDDLSAAWVAGKNIQWPQLKGARCELPARPLRSTPHWVSYQDETPQKSQSTPLSTGPLLPWLKSALAQVMGRDEPQIDVSAELSSLGVDSLRAVELLRRMQIERGILVYPTELYQLRSLEKIAAHLENANANKPQAQRERVREILSTHGDVEFPVAPKKLPGVVFLLSSPRTGSTLLRVMLAGHPSLFVPPELHLLAFSDLHRWHQRLSGDMLIAGLSHALIGLGEREEDAKRWVEQAVQEKRPTHEIYRHLQARAASRLLVDKSPSYGFNPAVLARAESLFENARYIHLTRHPVASIESFAKLRMHKLFTQEEVDPISFAEHAWTISNQNILRFLQEIPAERQHRIVYEEMVAAPEAPMRSLCQFLRVPFIESLLEPYSGERMVPKGVSSFIGDPNFGRHQKIEASLADAWRSSTLTIQEETRRVAATLGYKTAHLHLPQEIMPQGEASNTFRHVFLTGATGHLGPWILAQLLTQTRAEVYPLLRAKDQTDAMRRVKTSLQQIGQWQDSFEDRIHPQTGDLGRPRLGLTTEAWSTLRSTLDTIIHNGAAVNFIASTAQLEEVNVKGTQEVLRLACDGRLKVVHHVSTKGVFTPSVYLGEEPIEERDIPRQPEAGAPGYQQSKWAAEMLMHEARERGIPVSIYRPGRIGGDTKSGELPAADLFSLFLRACLMMKKAPQLSFAVELTPVDWVASSIIHLATTGSKKNYHLVHPKPVMLEQLVASLKGMAELIPYPAWREALMQTALRDNNPLAPLLSLFPHEGPERLDDRRLQTKETQASLQGGFAQLPTVEEQLAQALKHI